MPVKCQIDRIIKTSSSAAVRLGSKTSYRLVNKAPVWIKGSVMYWTVEEHRFCQIVHSPFDSWHFTVVSQDYFYGLDSLTDL